MSDERRKAAEEYAQERSLLFDRSKAEWTMVDVIDAYLAGDEAGARREREEIVKWIVAESDLWYDPHDKANFCGIADAIQRGEHRGGK